MTEQTPDRSRALKNEGRRNFLKLGGVTAAAASVGAAAGAGFALGRDPDSYAGYGRKYEGKDQFMDREPFRVSIDKAPSFNKVGEAERVHWTDNLFYRRNEIR